MKQLILTIILLMAMFIQKVKAEDTTAQDPEVEALLKEFDAPLYCRSDKDCWPDKPKCYGYVDSKLSGMYVVAEEEKGVCLSQERYQAAIESDEILRKTRVNRNEE